MLRRLARGLLFSLAIAAPRLSAQAGLIPADEAMARPSPARLTALADAGALGRWPDVIAAAQAASLAAYHQNRLQAAQTWHYVESWARLFAETEREFIPRWGQAVEAAGVRHGNMPATYMLRDRPLGDALNPELRRWLLGNFAFTEEFFSLVSDVDYLPRVFELLDELYRADPARFSEYRSLALAIALVYDVPPPREWPHSQVTDSVLPRRWPPAAAAFGWWVRQDQDGFTYHRLARLGADELKFVVDVAAPFNQLTWSQEYVRVPLGEFDQAYFLVRYRLDRAQAQAMVWPGRSYRLEDILADGGICVDQAYFATEVGKARGVPTLLFAGPGLDGRHAWFGYLDQHKRWQLDAGRYAEQRFLTGTAYDPQTWRPMSDHEVQFLAERFHALPSFRQSQVHAAFAAELLGTGRLAEAASSARKAVNYERRNVGAWETLLAVQQAQGGKPAAVEATLREAEMAFQRYPDLEAAYARRLTASLRARGETSQADFEEHRLVRKYQGDRVDLSIQQAAEILQRTFNNDPVPAQVHAYNSVLAKFGPEAGTDFFDKVVVVFAEHLMQLREGGEAMKAVERARDVLKPEPGRSLDQDFDQLLSHLR